MKEQIRFIFMTLVVATLVACSGKPKPEDTDPGDPGVSQGTSPIQEPVEVDRFDPTSLTNPEVITRMPAGNPLSTRVIYFDFDQATVRSEYREVLSAHATYLNANPGARMSLEGHADERGTREYNLGLSERRGFSVEELIDAQGGSDNQMTVVPYGEERSVADCAQERCWSQNRRVEIIYTRTQ